MDETNVQLRHLNKLKGQAPQPFLRYATSYETETIKVIALPSKKIHTERGPFLTLLPLALFLLLLSIVFIWLVPFPLDTMYRVILTILCLLFAIAGISSLEMVMKRWSTPNALMTQRVPAIKGDPLRVLAQDLGEDTNVYLERITR